MYVRLVDGYLNDEFVAGVEQFVEFCMTTVYYEKYGGNYVAYAGNATIRESYRLQI